MNFSHLPIISLESAARRALNFRQSIAVLSLIVDGPTLFIVGPEKKKPVFI